MTTASELFYNRRYRYNSRTTHSDLGLDPLSPPPPDRNHNHNHNRRHHDSDGCDPLRRSRHLSHRVSLTERAALVLDQGTHLGSNNGVGVASSPRLSGNERLPGAVLLARERLLERLRGMPPSGTRQRRRLHMGLMLGDDLSPVDERDRGPELLIGTELLTGLWTGRSASGSPSTDLSSQIGRLEGLQEVNKKPPGLTQEVLDCLTPELFSSTEMGVDGLVSRASRDCSICLEGFMEGDELICLPCAHRFHTACLSPWVRIRGDCPYCRRVIVVDSHTANRTM